MTLSKIIIYKFVCDFLKTILLNNNVNCEFI